MITLILCNGTDQGWDNYLGVPKQLAPVGGVPLLTRTVSQIQDRGSTPVIVSSNPTLMLPGVPHFSPGPDPPGLAVGLSSTELWSLKDPTALFLGDVYYSEAAMDRIFLEDPTDWQFYCRFGYNKDGSLGGGEGWAVKFWPTAIPRYRSRLTTLSRLNLPVCHFWQHYRVMNGADPLVHEDLGNHVIIDDLTDDFDYPKDYINWRKKYDQAPPEMR